MQSGRFQFQPDFVFTLVKVPADWEPQSIDDLPTRGEVVSQMRVASFEEAYEDLLRCNRFSMDRSLGVWAIVQTAEAEN